MFEKAAPRIRCIGRQQHLILCARIAIYVTLDLNRSKRGLIRVSQEPVERRLNKMSK
jgi:hypothetical protein